jgi:DNA-binding transcriptional LysR family regulator
MTDVLIDPRRLRSFVAVAEELNFTRAAERLGIAQQPLSQQIARLERDIGTRLFDRSTRRVTLTDAGRSLYSDALDLLQRHDDARRRALLASRGGAGRITVGCGSYAVESLVPALLRSLSERYPGVTVSLYEGHTVDQIEALRRGDIDIAFAISPGETDDLISETVSEAGFVVAMATKTETRTSRKPVPLTDFREARFIAAPRALSPGLDDLKARLFEDAGFMPNVTVLASQLSTMLTLVASGVGVLLTPGAIGSVARRDLTYVPIDTPQRIRLAMLTRRTARESAILGNVCQLAREIGAASADDTRR